MRKMLFLFVFFFLLISLIRNIADYHNSLNFYEVTKKNFEKAVEENKALKIKKLANSSAFQIEKNLRDKQNLSREHEVVIIVPPPSPTPTPRITPAIPIYAQWATIFFQ